jgi:hypothetical protein
LVPSNWAVFTCCGFGRWPKFINAWFTQHKNNNNKLDKTTVQPRHTTLHTYHNRCTTPTSCLANCWLTRHIRLCYTTGIPSLHWYLKIQSDIASIGFWIYHRLDTYPLCIELYRCIQCLCHGQLGCCILIISTPRF